MSHLYIKILKIQSLTLSCLHDHQVIRKLLFANSNLLQSFSGQNLSLSHCLKIKYLTLFLKKKKKKKKKNFFFNDK